MKTETHSKAQSAPHAKVLTPRQIAIKKGERAHRGYKNVTEFRHAMSIVAIWIRDGGKCGICGGGVILTDASVDHIKPLAKGGEHHPRNAQCAHRACNNRKGDRW